MNPLEELRAEFDRTFGHWSIRLPPDELAGGTRGKIVKAGWAIWYLIGSDERGPYLDYYASHRMTDDDHVRLRTDGTRAALPAIRSMRIASQDPEEDARLEAEFLQENQRTAELLEAKGFGLRGDEPGSILINRHLRTGL